MKLLDGSFTNFGSYKSVDLDFESKGLTLIHGPTGSGKSTIPDMVTWGLFGQTAKNGSVDDVKSWTSDGEPTKSSITLEIQSKVITVTRIRGKATENDLYWTENEADIKIRGKDITETQKLLEKSLGVSADLYLHAAYFSEFSPTGSFFVAKAKERRELLESLASLEFPVMLADKVSDEKKQLRKPIENRERSIATLHGRLDQVRSHIASARSQSDRWSDNQKKLVSQLREKVANFERDVSRRKAEASAKLEALRAQLVPQDQYKTRIRQLQAEKLCAHCGGISKAKVEQIQRLMTLESEDKARRVNVDTLKQYINEESVNSYKQDLETELARLNPFDDQDTDLAHSLVALKTKVDQEEQDLTKDKHRLQALDQLYELSLTLRGELLRRTVQQIEDATNTSLERYFDAPVRVKFSIEDSDKVSVLITKSGYECGFKSLSKGQRGLIKLAFGTSIMEAAANRAGIHFDQLWFDEALDGYDEELKLKAYRLFETLSIGRSSVFVIEHSEGLKELFSKRYHVSLINDNSEIEIE